MNKIVLSAMRNFLIEAAVALGNEYQKAKADNALASLPVGAACLVDSETPGYTTKSIIFHYGGCRFVSGAKIGRQTGASTLASWTVTNTKIIAAAVKLLSDKRVTSLVRNIAESANKSFPEHTYDYKKDCPLDNE